MLSTEFTIARLRELLEVHGSDLGRWPADRAAAAADLLSRSHEARQALERARDLDRILDLSPPPAVTRDRVDQVVAASLSSLPERSSPWTALKALFGGDWAWVWPRTAALAACALAGVVVGLVQPVPTGSADIATAATVEQRAVAVAAFAPSTIESLFE